MSSCGVHFDRFKKALVKVPKEAINKELSKKKRPKKEAAPEGR